MAVGIALVMAALAGLSYGVTRRNLPIALASAVALVAVAAVWAYFLRNPY